MPAHLTYMVAEARQALEDGDQDVADGVWEEAFLYDLKASSLHNHLNSAKTVSQVLAEAISDWIQSTAGRDWWANVHPAPAEDLSRNGVGSGWVL